MRAMKYKVRCRNLYVLASKGYRHAPKYSLRAGEDRRLCPESMTVAACLGAIEIDGSSVVSMLALEPCDSPHASPHTPHPFAAPRRISCGIPCRNEARSLWPDT